MTGFPGEPNPKSNSVHSSLVFWFLVRVSSSFGKVLLTIVIDVMLAELLPTDVGNEDVEEDELRNNDKVISNGVL